MALQWRFLGALFATTMLFALIVISRSGRHSNSVLKSNTLLYRKFLQPEMQVNPQEIALAYSPMSVLSTRFCKDTCRGDYSTCGQVLGRDSQPCFYLFIDCVENDCQDPNWQGKEVCFSSLRNNYLTCIRNNENIDYCQNVFHIQKDKC
uniref:Uncharacterized protein n=1 Tax=Guillardia theta TaxID=55529 RepID=A0A7S4NP40_GUITH|mmetsp:Transcript_28183/g.91330  ORF Transcript_28183/g.91330 Transcript_28183/m.91330 type:complete len:149 (+) Transcript_28183:56-502(+)